MDYTKSKLLINFVLVNIIINAIFYIVNFARYQGVLTLSAIQSDLLFGLVMLGLLCSITGFKFTRKDLTTGHVELNQHKFSSLHKVLPESNLVRSIILTIVFVGLVYPLFALIPSALGITTINHVVGFLIKTISAGVAAAGIGYLVISLSIEDYRSMVA